MLLRISNVLLIHPPFIDVLVQICPFYFCHFARRHRCLFEGVGACVCTCVFGGFKHLFSLSGVEKPVKGSGNGNNFLFSIFGDLGLMSVH